MSARQPPNAPPREPPGQPPRSRAGEPPGGGRGAPPRAPPETSAGEPDGPRPQRRGGLLRRTLLLVLIVLVMAAGAVLLFPDQLLLPWLLPAAQAAARARGLQLSVGHLRGTFSDTLELQDVRLATRDRGLPPGASERAPPRVELTVPSVVLRWSPWRALTGAPDPLDSLALRGGSLVVDLGSADAAGGEAWGAGALRDLGAQLEALPALSVDDLAVELTAPSHGALATPRLALHGTLHAQGRLLELRDGRIEGDGPAGRLPAGLALTAPARFDLSQLARDELPFALELAALDGTLSVLGTLRGEALEAHVAASGVQLAALWRAATGDVAPAPVTGPLRVDGEVRVPLVAAGAGGATDGGTGTASPGGEGRLGVSASARFTLGALSAWGLSLDSASGGLAWRDGTLHASDVQLARERNRAVLEDASLPGAALAELAAGARPVPWEALQLAGRVEVADLPALLAALRGAGLLPSLADARAGSFARQFAEQLAGGADAGEHGLALHAALRDGTLSVRDALFRTAGGTLSVPEAALDLRVADLADAPLTLRLDADFADLSPLGALLGEPPFPGSRSSAWGGSLAARVRCTGTVRAPVAELDVGAHGLVAGGWALGELTVRAVADARRLQVSALELQSATAHVSAQGGLQLADLTLSGVTAQVSVPDLAAALPESGLAGALSGSATLDGPLPLPLGTLELHVHDLLAHGLPVEDLDLAASHAPGLLTVSDATLRAPWGALRTAGTLRFAEPLPAGPPSAAWLEALAELRVDRLALARGSLELQLQEPVTLQHAGGRWSGGPVVFDGSAGRLRATLAALPAASGAGTLQRVQLVAENLQPLLALPSGSSVDTLDGDVDLAIGPDELSATGTLRALGLTLAEDDTALGAAVAGDVTAWLAVSGSPQQPQGTVELSANRLVLTVPGRLAPQGFGPCTLDAHVTLGERLAVDWLHVDSPHQIHLDGSGSLELPADPRAHWPDAAVHLAVSVSAGRLDRLSELLTDVRRLSGDLAAELTVDGTLGAPAARGSVVVHDGELRLQGALPALDALEAHLELEGDRLTIRALTGELGAAPFTISGEALLGPDGPSLDIALRGEDLLFYRADGVTVRADSDLAVRGPLSALAATGTLVLRHSGIVSSLNLLHLAQGGGGGPGRGLRLFSFREPPLSTLGFDVRITAAEPFLVRNNVVRGALRPDLRLTGTGQVPILDGTLGVEASRVILPAGGVNIDSGRVLFSAADPFVPRLDIAGSARRRGYDVSVLITGPYDRPVVSLSSVPPLPSDKILLLLLAGQAPGRGAVGPAGSDTTTHVVAVYLGQDLLARWLGDSPLGEEGLLDRLEVDVVKDLSRSNSDLLQLSYRLTPLPKRGGNVTFLRAEKDLYNRINFGVQFLFRIQDQ